MPRVTGLVSHVTGFAPRVTGTLPRGTGFAPRGTALPLAAVVAAAAVLTGGGPALAASPDVVVNAVYGGGGNSGATYTNDFVELRNAGATTVDLAGWSVQYASASGTTWQVTPLTGTVAPGGHVLVQEAQGAGGTTALPTPDVTGTIALSATSGKVALVTSGTALACGSACATAAGVRDFVGYGGANDAEGSPAPALSNTTAAARADGAADTDNNAVDFTAGSPDPRNSGGAGGGSGGGTGGVSGLRIADVQGAAQLSPYAGQRVLGVPGVVTAVAGTGFWMQDPTPDADPRTSDGVYVFTSHAPTAQVGDAVTVSGAVSEYRPGGTATNLTVTELAGGPTIAVTASGQPLPAPTLVGPGGRVPPSTVIEDDATGDVETTEADFDPANDGLDFWESLEGMRVELDDAAVVGPTNSYDELPVVPAGSGVRTARGGIVLQQSDPNPERIVLGDTLAPVPVANTGDTLTGATTGIVDYAFSNFMLQVTATPTLAATGPARETTRRARPDELATATFNVENLDPTDPPTKFAQLAAEIVTNLAAPDLLALEEVQDDTGPADDGTVTAGTTVSLLVAAIRAAGGPAYQWRSIDPQNDADGGEPGGNIRVGFLFRTDRGLSFVDRPGGTATSDTTVVAGPGHQVRLSASPGRVAPTDPAWASSRKPLAGEFRWRGQQLFVVANHFVSKGGDQPLYGRYQPPSRPSETQRHAQAQLVHDFVAGIEQADRAARVVVLGDLNDMDFSTTADLLTAGGSLVDLPRTLPLAERYTYVYEGNSEVLDHILLSPALAAGSPTRAVGSTAPAVRCGVAGRWDYDVVHVNSEYADQISDHAPQVVRLRF